MIAAIILSAGKSERMGRPKALLRFRGRTFLDHILDAIERSSIGPAILVVGHHRDAIEAAVRPRSVVFNPNYEQGMSTSVQAGVRALPEGTSGAAVFLVDHPLIEARTIDALASHSRPDNIVVPVHAGRRGHPVLFGAGLYPEILRLSPNEGLNMVVRRDKKRVVEVPVDAPGVIRDIDTPEDFGALLSEISETSEKRG